MYEVIIIEVIKLIFGFNLTYYLHFYNQNRRMHPYMNICNNFTIKYVNIIIIVG